ncbi:MAG: tRNA dimethylallyltransferase [Armatimonadetes bacterium]|nr:tRNA dimethylallyltransferase [Armatimonadota bacterium]
MSDVKAVFPMPDSEKTGVAAALARIPSGTPLVAIVGATASGKSDLGISLAREFNGEIISADSRQVFRGLDLGTGKVEGPLDVARGRDVPVHDRTYRMAPLISEGIGHWVIDVADAREIFTAAEFQVLAYDAMADIVARGRLPLLVGGTGLYLRAVTDGLVMPSVPPNPALRAAIEHLDAATLRARLLALDPDAGAFVDLQNPRRMVRAIEVASVAGPLATSRGISQVPFRTLTLGVEVERAALLERIRVRLLARLDAGMVDEVRRLHAEGLSHERMEDLGLEYRAISRFLRGVYGHEEMVDELGRAIARFARRQATWFRKYGNVRWISTPQEAHDAVANFLEQNKL